MASHCFPKSLSCPYPSGGTAGGSLVLTKRIAASKNEIREKRNVIKLFRVKTPSFSVLRYSLYMYIRGACHLHKPVEILVDKNLTTGALTICMENPVIPGENSSGTVHPGRNFPGKKEYLSRYYPFSAFTKKTEIYLDESRYYKSF